MSPVVLSVTTCSNASSSLISNLSVQKIQICEDISHTLLVGDSRTISDNLSHLSDNNSCRLSRSPLHFPVQGDSSLNLYSHTKNVESEETHNLSFQKSKSQKNSFKNLPKFPGPVDKTSSLLRHKKSESSTLQTIERTPPKKKGAQVLSLNNSIRKQNKFSQKIRMNQKRRVQQKRQWNHQKETESEGSSNTKLIFTNRLDCKHLYFYRN